MQQYKPARQVLEGAIKQAEAGLHPWHVFIFDARIPLINCCRATGDPVAALQVGSLITIFFWSSFGLLCLLHTVRLGAEQICWAELV